MVALLTITVGGLAVGSVVLARHRAQAAADLAALAAAQGIAAGGPAACGWAQNVAEAMGARLRGCRVAGLDVTVSVSVDTGLRLGGQAEAAARAGP